MANQLAFKITVNNSDGSLLYREFHEYGGLDDVGRDWFVRELQDFESKMRKSAGGKEDGANLSATLECTLNGQSVPIPGISGVSYKAMVRMQREWHHLGDKLIKIGEDKAKHKK